VPGRGRRARRDRGRRTARQDRGQGPRSGQGDLREHPRPGTLALTGGFAAGRGARGAGADGAARRSPAPDRRADRGAPRLTAAAPPRLDVWLVEHGLAESREKAQALVMAGRVRIDGQPASKPGMPVRGEPAVEVVPGATAVGRGGAKLEGAL